MALCAEATVGGGAALTVQVHSHSHQNLRSKIRHTYSKFNKYVDSGNLKPIDDMVSQAFKWTDVDGTIRIGKRAFIDLLQTQVQIGQPIQHSFKVKSIVCSHGESIAIIIERIQWRMKSSQGKL